MKDQLITSYKTELYRLAEGKNVETQLHAQLVHEKWFHYLAKRKVISSTNLLPYLVLIFVFVLQLALVL